MRIGLSVLVVSIGLLAAGCGKRGSSGNSVAGSVTYKGNPVTGGTMLFHGKDKDGKDKVFPASLGPDGNYSCQGVPAGDYTVTVDTKWLENFGDAESMMKKMAQKAGLDGAGEKMPQNQGLAKEPKGGAPKYVPIPPKYADKKTSTLTVKVESGNNSKDLPLTD